MKYILPLCFAVLFAACGDSGDNRRSAKDDCQAALSNDHEFDARSFQLHIDDVPSFGANPADESLLPNIAEEAIQVAATQAGCDGSKLTFDEGTVCQTLQTDNSLSRVCFAQIETLGYFIVSETLPEGIAVTYSRFD